MPAFLFVFLVGGLTGIFLAALPLDVHLTTYFCSTLSLCYGGWCYHGFLQIYYFLSSQEMYLETPAIGCFLLLLA